MTRGWIVRYVSNGCITVSWCRSRKSARMEQCRWPGAVLIRVTD